MTRVLAIGIDAAEWSYVEPMLDSGRLPNLAKLRSSGTCHRLVDDFAYDHGLVFEQLLAGRHAALTPEWESMTFDPRTYSSRQTLAGRPEGAPAFYERVDGLRTILFDVPWSSLESTSSVVSVVGWGASAPMHPRASRPAGLVREIDRRIGPHPGFNADYTTGWHDPHRIDAMIERSVIGAQRRAQASAFLQERFPDWDLFMVVMSETHSPGEFLWQGVDATHPLANAVDSQHAARSLERAYVAVDEAIGQMVANCPADTAVVVFSLYGVCSGPGDVPSIVLLPELLHRLAGGEPAVRSADPAEWKSKGCPPVVPAVGETWLTDIDRFWLGPDEPSAPKSFRSTVHKLMNRRLSTLGRLSNRLDTGTEGNAGGERYWVEGETHLSSRAIRADGGPSLDWQFAVRYRRWWREMRAFAIPTFSSGMVRVNLIGREAEGIVAPGDYGAACDEVEAAVRACINPRTGAPAVRGVNRSTSDDPRDPHGPYADLTVEWDGPVDAIEHPVAGLIGPVPFHRSGAHSPRGFLITSPAGGWARESEASRRVGGGHRAMTSDVGTSLDVPPTILTLLGVPMPDSIEGRSLVTAPAVPQ